MCLPYKSSSIIIGSCDCLWFITIDWKALSTYIYINPLAPISDQDRISPYNINDNIEQTSDENKEKYQLEYY